MKKIISIVMVTAVLMLFVITSFAENAFKITVGTLDQALNVKENDEIVVPVYLSGNVGVYSYALEYSFDPDVLELQDDKMKQNGKGDYKCLINDFTINNRGDNVIILSLASGDGNVTDNGVIAYLFFKVKQGAKRGFSEIKVTYKNGNVCNYAAKALYPEKVSGGVYVHSDNLPESSETSVSSKPSGSDSTSSQPIGYVPPSTLPDTAPDYYSSQIMMTSSNVQSASSDIVSGKDENQSSDVLQQTESTSSRWNADEIEVNGEGLIGRNALIAIIVGGVVVIAGAVVSFIVSNKK